MFQNINKKIDTKKTGILVACFWSLVLFLSLYANILQEYKTAEKQAALVARANLDRDKAVRQWVSDRGGVYAKINELTQPSPYLAHIPTRDIHTPVGEMTLLNPAYMLRLMMDEHELLYGIKGRIVGLKALRPENIADDWERRAISQFEADRELEDYTEIDEINGASYLRMMVPMYMTPDCMKCHSILGYQVGDLRGGVNVSVPMSDYYALAKVDSIRLGYAHGGIWLLGLFGVGFVTKRSVKAEKLRSRDFQELKETEKALLDSELWMKSIYNSLDEAVLVLSPDREIVNVNNAAVDMFEYSAEEIRNSSTELFHVDHQHFMEFGERINQAFSKGKTAKFEFEAKKKSGEIFPTEHTVSLLKNPDGEIKGIVSVIKDITERKSVEKALLKSEARLNEAQRLTKVGAWELDLLTNELSWSDEIFRIFEIDKNKFCASYGGFLHAIHPEDRYMVDKAYSDSLADKKPYEITHRLQMSDGRIKYVQENCESYFDSDGKAVRSVGTIHDITERKQAEEALKDSQRYNRMLFEQTSIGLALCRMDGELVDINPAYAQIIGRSVKEAMELSYWDITPEKYVEDEQSQLEKLKNSGCYGPYEKEYIHKDGHLVPVSLQGLLLERGGETFIWSSVEDITKRKKTEEELAHAQEMLEQANKVAKMGAWSFDLITNELVWSDITKEIHEVEVDFKPDIEAGINFYKKGVHRDTINRIVMEAIQKGGSWDEELVIVTAKGNEKWVRAMGQPEFKDGACIRLYGSFQDITERKLAEQSFHSLAENMQDGVLVNFEAKHVFANASLARMLGYKKAEELIGTTIKDIVHPDELENVLTNARRRAQGEKVVSQYESLFITKAGEKLPVELNASLTTWKGKPAGMVTIRDITERKQNEIELQQYRHQLEMLVEDRTAELQQSLMEKEVLLKEVHHRVKNNMAMVSAFIQLQMNGTDDVYSLGALGACESRIQAMSMVHKRLYQSNDFTNIDMQTLFDEISGALFKKSDFDNIELDIQANGIYLEMDAAIPCAMIINELLSNSLKYAFKDGQAGKIKIRMELVENGLYRIRVSDSGAGIPEDVSMENAETLGLQLVNVFVGQLNGEVKTSRGHGAVFEIVFPAGKATNA